MADARHRTIGAMVFPNLDSWIIRRCTSWLRTSHLTEHLNPRIVGTAKMERYHLKAVSLEPYMAKVQLAIEQLQSLKKLTSASWG